VLRWLAPVAFLAGLTIAVLLVRAGLHHTSGTTTPTATTPTLAAEPSTTAGTTPSPKPGTKPATAGARFATVQSGDTYGSIASKYGTTVQQLEALNPGISSNSLSVGQKIRVK
jgi:LysM repeat protein